MNKEIREKLRTLSPEEFVEYCKTLQMKKYFRLAYSFETVMKMWDFIQVLDKNPKDFNWEGNKAVVEDTANFKPSQCLYEFIIAEISAFYTNAHQHITQGDNLPKIPQYWDTLKKFRNAMPGHRDNQQNFKVIVDWMIAIKEVDDINSSGIKELDDLTPDLKGTDKIIRDFINYFKELLIKFPNDVK